MENYIVNNKFRNVPKLSSFIELFDLMHSLRDLTCPVPQRDCPTIASARSVSIFSEVLRGVLQGIQANLGKTDVKKKGYNVWADPEPMYHVTHAQTSR